MDEPPVRAAPANHEPATVPVQVLPACENYPQCTRHVSEADGVIPPTRRSTSSSTGSSSTRAEALTRCAHTSGTWPTSPPIASDGEGTPPMGTFNSRSPRGLGRSPSCPRRAAARSPGLLPQMAGHPADGAPACGVGQLPAVARLCLRIGGRRVPENRRSVHAQYTLGSL